jgi:hypothetical protein
VKRPACHVMTYSQKGESRAGPVGKCESSLPIWLLSSAKSELPLKAPTGMEDGTVQLHSGWQVQAAPCMSARCACALAARGQLWSA